MASYGTPLLASGVVAGADLSSSGIYRFVKLSTDNTVILCPADNASLGILQNAPKSGQAAEVAIPGSIGALLRLAGTVAAGDYIKADASGNGVLANAGEFAGAIAMTAGVANDVISVIPRNTMVPAVVVSVYMADISAASSAYAVSPVAGRVVRVDVVTQGAITGADDALTAKVGATGMTGGTFTLPVSGAAAGQVASCTPTALNVVAQGGMLALATDGASSTTTPAMVNFVIVPKAA